MIAPAKPRPITGCIILAAAPVDAVVDAPVVDEVPALVVPPGPVLVPVAVTVVAVWMLAVEVRVVFLSDETTTTEDNDGEGTGGKLVLAGEMTEATGG